MFPRHLSLPPLTRWVLATVVGAFVIFNANFRELGLADTIPATLLAANIVRHGDLTLDAFEPMLDERAPDGFVTLRKQFEWTLAARRVRGHLRSSYPVGPAILASPVYVAPVVFDMLHGFHDYRVVGKLAASLIAAISAAFVFLSLLRFCGRTSALLLTVVYALGTSVWSIASQALWQHGPALLCLSLALWAALRLREHDRAGDAVLVSIGAGMAVVCRPQDAIGSLSIGLFALVSRPRRAPFLVLPAALIGALLAVYNVHAFGNVSGGYEDLYASPAHAFRHITPENAFTLPLAEGLSGLLVSPSRGLFVYSPVLAVAFGALAITALAKEELLARTLLVWVVVTLCLWAKFRLWWAGTSYGPRYLTELALPLVLGLGMAIHRIRAHAVLSVAVVALSVFGIGVQALGAATWECGWHYTPGWVHYGLERLWDYKDPEILRCARVFVEQGPKPADFGPLAPGSPAPR